MNRGSEDVSLSELTSFAQQVATHLRAQNRPLPVIGHKQETRQVERRGFMGRSEMVTETVASPVTLPGWPIGVNRTMLKTATSQAVDEVVLTPDGQIATVRVDRGKPEDVRVISPFARYAVRVAQSRDHDAEWTSTGNANDVAARYTRSITAGQAVRQMIAQLQRI